jgi:hypothetical protein
MEEANLICCPPVSTKLRSTPKEPWFIPGLLRSRYVKEKLYRKCRQKNTPENWSKYRNYRNCYNRCLRSAKVRYYNQEFDKSGKNSKRTWELAREITGFGKKKGSEIGTVEGLEESADKADAFNGFYCNIASNLENNLPTTDCDFKAYLPKLDNIEPMSFKKYVLLMLNGSLRISW